MHVKSHNNLRQNGTRGRKRTSDNPSTPPHAFLVSIKKQYKTFLHVILFRKSANSQTQKNMIHAKNVQHGKVKQRKRLKKKKKRRKKNYPKIEGKNTYIWIEDVCPKSKVCNNTYDE